jgi:hypothetical protein
MKLKVLLLLVIATACGPSAKVLTDAQSVNELRESKPQTLSNSDRQKIISICQAFSQKASTLDSLIGTKLNFVTAETDCSGNMASSGTTQVTLQKSGGDYVLKRVADNLDFIFPEIETHTSGLLASVCSSPFESPVIEENRVIYFTTEGITTRDCVPATGEICVAVEIGRPEGVNNRIHTREWLRVRTDLTKNRVGFFTYRKKLTKAYCGENEALLFTAILQ